MDMVTVRLGAPRDVCPVSSKTPLPAPANIYRLHGAAAFHGTDAHQLLHDDSSPTALEAMDGNCSAAHAALGGPALSASLGNLVPPSTSTSHPRAGSPVPA